MKLLNGLSSNKYITINDEEKVKKFISNFDKYENRIELLPDYNIKETSKTSEVEELHLKRYKKAYNLFMESWDKLPKENQSYLTAKLEELEL
jgi:hypothetical protein